MTPGPDAPLGPWPGGAFGDECHTLLIKAYDWEKPFDRFGVELSLGRALHVRGDDVRPRISDPEVATDWGIGLGLDPGSRFPSRFGGRIDIGEDDDSDNDLGATVSAWMRS